MPRPRSVRLMDSSRIPLSGFLLKCIRGIIGTSGPSVARMQSKSTAGQFSPVINWNVVTKLHVTVSKLCRGNSPSASVSILP